MLRNADVCDCAWKRRVVKLVPPCVLHVTARAWSSLLNCKYYERCGGHKLTQAVTRRIEVTVCRDKEPADQQQGWPKEGWPAALARILQRLADWPAPASGHWVGWDVGTIAGYERQVCRRSEPQSHGAWKRTRSWFSTSDSRTRSEMSFDAVLSL